jgi:membrane protein
MPGELREGPADRSRWQASGWRGALAVLRDAGRGWDKDNALRLGAALSFYAVLAFPPILVVAISLAGLLFGQGAAEEGLLRQLSGLLGTSGSRMFKEMIRTASKPKEGLLATGLGLLVLLFGATGVFVELRDALNLIWKVPSRGGLLRGLLRGRFLAFGLVGGTGFLLIVSLVVSAGLAALAHSLGSRVDGLDGVVRGLDFGVSFAVIATLFALIFKILPDVPLSWRDVWLGAGVTSLLFTAGKFGIGAYLGTTQIATAYGAAGSVVLLLLWVYYSSLIFFFGAELTRSYAFRYGSMALAPGM